MIAQARIEIRAHWWSSFTALVPRCYGQNLRADFRDRVGLRAKSLRCLVLLASYELAIRQIVGRRLDRAIHLPRWLLFWNTFVETSVPSIRSLCSKLRASGQTNAQPAVARRQGAQIPKVECRRRSAKRLRISCRVPLADNTDCHRSVTADRTRSLGSPGTGIRSAVPRCPSRHCGTGPAGP